MMKKYVSKNEHVPDRHVSHSFRMLVA